MARENSESAAAGPERPGDKPGQSFGLERTVRGPVSDVTTATYDEIAHIYYDHTHDRSAIHEHLVRFADMIRAYGLVDLPIVDVGCGPGFDAAFFRGKGLRAVGVDLSPTMIKIGREEFGGDYVLADMRRLPFSANIGGLWVSASFLHLPRVEAPVVLQRFGHFMVPGALLYVSVKAGRGAEWTAESHGQPRSRYFVYWQPEGLDALLHEANFRIVEGWTSPVDEETTWIFRFARKATGDLNLPLRLA